MPSRADKANVTFDYKKDIHLSAACTFCFYLRRRKKVLLKQNFQKFQPPITTIYSFAFDKIKQKYFISVTFAYKKDIHLSVPFAFTLLTTQKSSAKIEFNCNMVHTYLLLFSDNLLICFLSNTRCLHCKNIDATII